jgi:hypothetical protein
VPLTTEKVMGRIWVVILLIVLGLIMIFARQSVTYRPLTESELVELTDIRYRAYNYAVKCSGTTKPSLTFDEIEWMIAPGSVLRIKATDGTAILKGWFDPENNIIWVPYTERKNFWILAHESLHAIGYIGHPYYPFTSPCRLMPEQN